MHAASPRTIHRDHVYPRVIPSDELMTAVFGFHPSDPQPARHRGRFWIGTYENRPATNNGDGTFTAREVAGNTQGDELQGTLTSEPFTIGDPTLAKEARATIEFLIGGGCNILTQYVELLIDDRPADNVNVQLDRNNPNPHNYRATGKCQETMERTTWDVTQFIGRSGRIRIVDASSSLCTRFTSASASIR